jgi:hypothetical protein
MNTGADGQSGKTTNSSGVKTLEMIPGASGLLIECGLFLWLSIDIGKLLKLLDHHAWSAGSSSLSMVKITIGDLEAQWGEA